MHAVQDNYYGFITISYFANHYLIVRASESVLKYSDNNNITKIKSMNGLQYRLIVNYLYIYRKQKQFNMKV